MKLLGRQGISPVLGLQDELFEEKYKSGGAPSKTGNYFSRQAGKYLTLGMLGLAAAGAVGCGRHNPTGPTDTDMCNNIDGIQLTVPAGYMRDGDGNCYPNDDGGGNGGGNASNVSGSVTDRISGSRISGSTITYAGPVTKSAQVVGGHYEINGLEPGNYEVTITGNNLAEPHKNLSVPLPEGGATGNFSGLVRGSGHFGATYDNTFAGFFRRIARGDSTTNAYVRKWLTSPTEMYLTEGDHDIMDILDEINNESVSGMYCGKTGSLPIRKGPPIGRQKDGSIVITFGDHSATVLFPENSPIVTSAWIELSTHDLFELNRPRVYIKYVIAHELFHAAFAQHAFNTYMDSLMGGRSDVTNLSKEDKLASCIVYDDDTHPGNTAPDTNPSYTAG